MTATVEHTPPRTSSILALVAVPPVASGLIVTAVLVVLLGVVGLVAGLLLTAVAVAFLLWRIGQGVEDRVLRQLGARPAGDESERLRNLVEGLAVGAGVPEPELHVVDDPAANAMVIGRDPRQSHLVVTAGLLEALSRVELEGVVARALAQLKAGDVPAATLAVSALGAPLAAAEQGSGAVAFMRPLLPAAAGLLARLAPDGADVDLDRAGVALTRYPPGLAGALRQLEGRGTGLARPVRATAHLWLADAGGGPADGGMFPARTPLALRIEALGLL